MGLYEPGLNSAGAYQVSGRPFFKGGLTATTTVQVLKFPTVTSWIYIANTDETTTDDFLVAFSENGFDTGEYFTSPSINFNFTPDEAFPWKVAKIYYKRQGSNDVSFDVVAGLTSIPTGSIPNNWSGSAGVG